MWARVLALIGLAAVAVGCATRAAVVSANVGQRIEIRPGVPSPCFDCVSRDHSERYLEVLPSAGNIARVQEVAATLIGAGPREKLSAIGLWVRSHLRGNKSQDHYHWRTFEQILAEGDLYGCADNALVFGLLARVAGIPTMRTPRFGSGSMVAAVSLDTLRFPSTVISTDIYHKESGGWLIVTAVDGKLVLPLWSDP